MNHHQDQARPSSRTASFAWDSLHVSIKEDRQSKTSGKSILRCNTAAPCRATVPVTHAPFV
jgi:hypothetical protein